MQKPVRRKKRSIREIAIHLAIQEFNAELYSDNQQLDTLKIRKDKGVTCYIPISSKERSMSMGQFTKWIQYYIDKVNNHDN